MTVKQGPAPGFLRHRHHRISIREGVGRWLASFGDTVLADSEHVRILEESGYGEATYFPAADVKLAALTQTASETACPFKGRAQYFRLADGADDRDVAWSYPNTYDEVDDIAGYVAFYADRVSIKNS